MIEKTTVAIAPEVAVRAFAAENEWRRNRILVLEQQLFEAEQRNAELERQLAEQAAAASGQAAEPGPEKAD